MVHILCAIFSVYYLQFTIYCLFTIHNLLLTIYYLRRRNLPGSTVFPNCPIRPPSCYRVLLDGGDYIHEEKDLSKNAWAWQIPGHMTYITVCPSTIWVETIEQRRGAWSSKHFGIGITSEEKSTILRPTYYLVLLSSSLS